MKSVESTLEITTVAGCRVACQVCPQDTFLKVYRGPRMLSFETFVACVDKVPDWVQIDFSGFSEPWLNESCSDMVEYAAKRHDVYVYTTLTGMSKSDAQRVARVRPKLLGIHIRDVDDKSPIHDVDLSLSHILNPTEYISHGLPHEEVVPQLLPGVRVSLCQLHSRGGLNWSVPYRSGPLRCSSTRRFRHNVLLPSGEVLLCCTDYGMKHRLGNLLHNTYESLFVGEYERIKSGSEHDIGDILCRRCEIAESLPPQKSMVSNG